MPDAHGSDDMHVSEESEGVEQQGEVEQAAPPKRSSKRALAAVASLQHKQHTITKNAKAGKVVRIVDLSRA